LIKRVFSPNSIGRTGDDTPAASLASYVWRMSGGHQIALCTLAILTALGNLLPIELQRRIVDNAIEPGAVDVLITLGLVYLATLLMVQALKFAMRLYQGWISESAILYCRRQLLRLHGDRVMPGKDDDSGRVISIVNSEIDNLGGFLGEGPSQMVTNAALLIGSVAYMLIVEPMVALVGFAFLTPQIILAPLMQRKLNRLTEQRLHLMRKLGQKVPEIDDPTDEADLHVLPRIYGNRLRYFILKFALKAALNFLNALGPLAVLAFGGWMVIQGETTVGVIVAFITESSASAILFGS